MQIEVSNCRLKEITLALHKDSEAVFNSCFLCEILGYRNTEVQVRKSEYCGFEALSYFRMLEKYRDWSGRFLECLN